MSEIFFYEIEQRINTGGFHRKNKSFALKEFFHGKPVTILPGDIT
jgi:hypothetical protein